MRSSSHEVHTRTVPPTGVHALLHRFPRALPWTCTLGSNAPLPSSCHVFFPHFFVQCIRSFASMAPRVPVFSMRNPFCSGFCPVWRVLGRGRELRLRLRRTFHVQLQRTFAPLVVAAMAQTRRTSVVWVDEDAKDDRSETGGASERVVDLTVAGNTPKRRKKPDEECVIVREIKVCARSGAAEINRNV